MSSYCMILLGLTRAESSQNRNSTRVEQSSSGRPAGARAAGERGSKAEAGTDRGAETRRSGIAALREEKLAARHRGLLGKSTVATTMTNAAEGANAGNLDAVANDEGPTQEDSECPICFEVTFPPTRTRCGHTFCLDCLARHVQTHSATCPYCRTDIETEFTVNQDLLENIERNFPDRVNAHNANRRQNTEGSLPCKMVDNFMLPGETLDENTFDSAFEAIVRTREGNRNPRCVLVPRNNQEGPLWFGVEVEIETAERRPDGQFFLRFRGHRVVHLEQSPNLAQGGLETRTVQFIEPDAGTDRFLPQVQAQLMQVRSLYRTWDELMMQRPNSAEREPLVLPQALPGAIAMWIALQLSRSGHEDIPEIRPQMLAATTVNEYLDIVQEALEHAIDPNPLRRFIWRSMSFMEYVWEFLQLKIRSWVGQDDKSRGLCSL